MLPRLTLAISLSLCAFAAQETTTVAELVKLVRAGMENRDKDADLAKALHRIRLSERLDYRVLDALESAGVGPKSYAELEILREASRKIAPPPTLPDFPQEPMPSREDQHRIVRETQVVALNYSGSLPDFFCTQVVRRYDDLRGGLSLRDTLEIKLTYFEGKEEYRVLTVNGRANLRSFDEIGGSTSRGEFASMLNLIFTGKSKAVLQWDHWTKVRNREAHVYRFTIKPENALYQLQFRSNNRLPALSVVVGQRGFLYIDRASNEVLRIVAEADQIPPKFPMRHSSTVLDYDYVDVGGRKFLLPLRADVRSSTDSYNTRNIIEFHGYRKFSGESSITFQ